MKLAVKRDDCHEVQTLPVFSVTAERVTVSTDPRAVALRLQNGEWACLVACPLQATVQLIATQPPVRVVPQHLSPPSIPVVVPVPLPHSTALYVYRQFPTIRLPKPP